MATKQPAPTASQPAPPMAPAEAAWKEQLSSVFCYCRLEKKQPSCILIESQVELRELKVTLQQTEQAVQWRAEIVRRHEGILDIHLLDTPAHKDSVENIHHLLALTQRLVDVRQLSTTARRRHTATLAAIRDRSELIEAHWILNWPQPDPTQEGWQFSFIQ